MEDNDIIDAVLQQTGGFWVVAELFSSEYYVDISAADFKTKIVGINAQ
jgi:hypothetical protein